MQLCFSVFFQGKWYPRMIWPKISQYFSSCISWYHGGSHGLMVRETHNPKVASSSLGPAGIVGGGSECTALSPPSIPWLRWDPWVRHRTPNCSPGATALAAHCSGCVFTVCLCSLLCVCALWMGWLQSRNSEYGSPYLATRHVTSITF